jgi:hypothetical protein
MDMSKTDCGIITKTTMTMMMMMMMMILRVIQNILEHPSDKVHSFYFNAYNLYIDTGLFKS